ncbi:winged helix-turn-helix domain-containing protein [Natronocalculus amylovorans]|uniref:Winged helix-turn-helix domain-containing protein n=1 Tax=Natronocalculus amylovorans TaxID=2917812 RepID=A0AAE3FYB1_9EURY|nr:winged helix-turn-helix domain-containing protein [Natronocalculus amylovorans]MCL9817115.1 winged helix-turn-helix domain-containing protein [Natronocalculus amylovorans]NUE02858.1 winged helix-turn-helix transcriptional regulator [Halorubraceae archaeon YAN]
MKPDLPDDESTAGDEESADTDETASRVGREEFEKTKARLEDSADKAVAEFDEGIVDLLAWVLDTETRARIFVYLRQHPNQTSDEIAEGTGLYPSTVREALAELHDEGKVLRDKRESEGAGNNPFEYEAIAPSELVRGVVGQVQTELNTVFNLDRRLGGKDEQEDTEPVTITVEQPGDSDAVGEESQNGTTNKPDDE